MSALPFAIRDALHNLELAVQYPSEWHQLKVINNRLEKGTSVFFHHSSMLRNNLLWLHFFLDQRQDHWNALDGNEKKIIRRFLRLLENKKALFWFSGLKDAHIFYLKMKEKLTQWLAFQALGKHLFKKATDRPKVFENQAHFAALGHLSCLVEFHMKEEKTFTFFINPNQAESVTLLHQALFVRIRPPLQDIREIAAPDAVLITDNKDDVRDFASLNYLAQFQPVVCVSPQSKIRGAFLLDGKSHCLFFEKQTVAKIWLSCIALHTNCKEANPSHTNSYVLSLPYSTSCDSYFHLLFFGQFECCSKEAIASHCASIKACFPHIDLALMPIYFRYERQKKESYPKLMAMAANLLSPQSIFTLGLGTWNFVPYARIDPYAEFYMHLTSTLQPRVSQKEEIKKKLF
jgi:hypothetical protein